MHLACTLHITWEYHFWYTWTILFSKIYHMLGLSGTLSYAVFVYLCIFVFVFLYLRFWHMGISFLIYLNNPLFKNILHVGSFWHFVICCICVFVCLCICVFVFGLGRSLLDQFGQKNASPLSSTFWFESSKPSYLFKSVLLLQPYSIWVGGLAPVVKWKHLLRTHLDMPINCQDCQINLHVNSTSDSDIARCTDQRSSQTF